MSDLQIGFGSFPLLLLLIFLRVPVGLAMLSVGLFGTYVLRGSLETSWSQLNHLTYGTFSSYSLSIVPLFLLMGQLATLGGISNSLFRAAGSWLAHRRGGMAMSVIGACAGFGAICGSSLATAATMCQVALPELRKSGCSGALATGTLAAGGTLGILIPPSVILVIYAILTEQNVGKLFAAALLPGLLAAAGYMLAISVYTRLVPGAAGEVQPRQPYAERFRALLTAWPVLIIFVVVVGGIYAGIFTPTEGAAVGTAATGLVAYLSGNLDFAKARQAVLSTGSSTAMIFFIVLGAGVFNSFLAQTGLAQEAAAFVGGQGFSPWVILAGVLALYLVFGCIMDSLSMVLLTVPIFYPIMLQLDFGLSPDDFALWFGILILIVVEVGLITPPVGMNLFVINAMAPDIPIGQTFRGVMPFVLTDLIRIVVLVVFPSLTLVLVRILY
jgi:C4-dicarboxylate transporter, DctM subunit